MDTICTRCRRLSVFLVPGVLCCVNGCTGRHAPLRRVHKRHGGGYARIRELIPDLLALDPTSRAEEPSDAR